MPLEQHRKNRIDAIVADLQKISGVAQAQSDDWDSAGINVFAYLQVLGSRNYKNRNPMFFAAKLITVRNAIKRVMKAHDVPFAWLDNPVKEYSNQAPMFYGGKWEKQDEGYSTDHFKLVVYI